MTRPSVKNTKSGLLKQLIRVRKRLRDTTEERNQWVDIAFKDLWRLEKVGKIYYREHKKLIKVRARLDWLKHDPCHNCHAMTSPSWCRGCGVTVEFRESVADFYERRDEYEKAFV